MPQLSTHLISVQISVQLISTNRIVGR